MKLWALHDKRPSTPQQVTEPEARKLNQDGWGIFHTPNEHTGRRVVQNLTRIHFWFCEIDGGKKGRQLKQLENAPLPPTRVVESAAGYHAFWAAKDATIGRWRSVEKGLVKHFDADPKATDPLRLLRVPGYYHHKAEPFLVKELWHCPWYSYTQEQMRESYPYAEQVSNTVPTRDNDGPYHVDARIGIPALNGHDVMGGESFELKPTANGNHNIIRLPDEYSTGCFVDRDGYIGGNRLGTTLYAWCKWYGSEKEDILKAIAEAKQAQAGPEETPAPTAESEGW